MADPACRTRVFQAIEQRAKQRRALLEVAQIGDAPERREAVATRLNPERGSKRRPQRGRFSSPAFTPAGSGSLDVRRHGTTTRCGTRPDAALGPRDRRRQPARGRRGDDGILTALEASYLDLDGVDLVTLSACETAKGTAESGEGVLGLVQAFQMAGARRVSRASGRWTTRRTRRLMDGVYERCCARRTRSPRRRATRGRARASRQDGRLRQSPLRRPALLGGLRRLREVVF